MIARSSRSHHAPSFCVLEDVMCVVGLVCPFWPNPGANLVHQEQIIEHEERDADQDDVCSAPLTWYKISPTPGGKTIHDSPGFDFYRQHSRQLAVADSGQMPRSPHPPKAMVFFVQFGCHLLH